jgi:hypothetical protein
MRGGGGSWRFNVTFNNISVLSWRPVLLMEETGLPGENHIRVYFIIVNIELSK